MQRLLKEEGVALVVVLAIVAISTGMIALVLHYVQRGSEVSLIEKKYAIAKEASLGTIEVFTKEVIPLAISTAKTAPSTSLTTALGNFRTITSVAVTAGATSACFSDKLLKATVDWADGCSSDSDPKTLPDVRFTLTGTSTVPFYVYAKIVDTVSGNTNTSGVVLEGAGTAESAGGMITSQHFPYMYRMEFQGERQNNPDERANFEVLYAY